ncbi:hypothetical protein [Bergeriella denitrificans]|uniref:Zinc metalloprotease zmpB n=1 Tax=Bergeriella denitrificans TaxID=494 RepID=A0A378UHY4_BERDE|nr:hypothetical protein [Bergeriella denitrificans]STZ76946.1 Zinc metalloprotease zmpB [Bergeriella denitrificans]
MSQSSKSFQLKPKHLIAAVLGLCLIAVIALIIGVVGTLKPRNEATAEPQTKQEDARNRVEVWKPQGANRQGTIILNPENGQAPATAAADTDADGKPARGNPLLPAPAAATTAAAADNAAERPHRVQPRPAERPQPRPQPANTDTRTAQDTAAADTAAEPRRSEPALVEPKPKPKPKPKPQPEPRDEPKTEPKPKADSKPAPQPKPAAPAAPQHKEVIDNLF